MDKLNIFSTIPINTVFYSTIYGYSRFIRLINDEIYFKSLLDDTEFCTNSYGQYNDFGECTIYPSKIMRDWDKYCWKIGDVLQDSKGNMCLFNGWYDASYFTFKCKWYNGEYYRNIEGLRTCDFELSVHQKSFITDIQKRYDSLLNLETLNLERSFKPGDIVTFYIGTSRNIGIFQQQVGDTISFACKIIPYNNKIYYNVIVTKSNINKMVSANNIEKDLVLNCLLLDNKKWDSYSQSLVTDTESFHPKDYILVKNKYTKSTWELYQYAYEDSIYYHTVGGTIFSKSQYIIIPYNDTNKVLLGRKIDYKKV